MSDRTLTGRDRISLLVFLVLVLAVAAVGGLAAGSARATYDALTLPSWAPPGWLFGPVWGVLYLMIGVAGWLLWRAGPGRRRRPLLLWSIQLLLNLIWTPLFFGADRYGLALVEIVVLWLAIVATLESAARVSRTSALLMLPYLGWVSFAMALNAAVWWLN
jgi:benzodiazapine receptor